MGAGTVVLMVFTSAVAVADEPLGNNYVYLRVGGAGPALALESETGVGTRDARLLGHRGVEQEIRLRWQPLAWMGLEASGGLLFTERPAVRPGAGVDVYGRLLRQAAHAVDLQVAAGYGFDYRGDHLLRFRGVLGRGFGRFEVVASGLVEVPLTGRRDEADVMLEVAASLGLTDWYRQGFEVCLEDLEGLWEANEAEGGAKILAGPTASFQLGGGFVVKLNAALVHTLSSGQPTAAGTPPALGFMGRLVLGYGFR